VTVSLRAAGESDLDFLVELYADEDVRPFLAAAGSYDRDGIAAKIAQEPESGGLLVVELDGDPAGAMGWELGNRRSRIARVSGLAVHPRFRGLLQHRLIRELGFHRIELEIYGFNERAQRHAERAGFKREGVKRQAYARGDGWVDGVLYGLVSEDLDEPR
jgi:hypothetical protein